jgi:hypothetical protein
MTASMSGPSLPDQQAVAPPRSAAGSASDKNRTGGD